MTLNTTATSGLKKKKRDKEEAPTNFIIAPDDNASKSGSAFNAKTQVIIGSLCTSQQNGTSYSACSRPLW